MLRRKRNLINALCAASLLAAPGISSAVPVTFDLSTATLEDVQKAMDAKALTSVELVNLYMQRIATYDQAGVKLNSVPALNPHALEDAAAADAARAAGKTGPLLGVPFVIKGSIAAKGMPLTNGITPWVDLMSPFDAFLLQKLKEAGAVFLGHANLDQFQTGTGGSTSQNWGTVKNAYVPYTNSGGSSGGSAVATGANMAFFAIGCETGGSIRVPSDRAGVVGIKSSNSMISVRGAVPLAADRDEPGPMTRYAIDNARVLDVVTALDPKDVWNLVQLSPGRARASDYATKFAAGSLTGKTIGVLTNYLATSAQIAANTQAEADIDALFQQAKADLTAAGATVVDVTLPIKEGDASTYIDIAYTGRRDSIPSSIAAGSEPKRVLYNPVTADLTGSMVPEAKAFPFQELIKALATTSEDSENQKLATVMRWINPVSTSSISQAMRDAIVSKTTYGFDGALAQQHFQAVRYQIADYETWLATAGPGGTPIDALIFPVATRKTIGTNPDAVGGSSSAPGRTLINSFSLPFITVPMGVLPSGEPSDLGFLGNKYFADADLMALVGAYEAGTKKRIVSPLAPALAAEHIEYDPDAAPVPGPVQDVVAPAATVAKGAKVTGSGNKTRLTFSGAASDSGGIASVAVTINGQRIPVSINGTKWSASAKLPLIKKLLKKGVRTVKVVIVIRDTSGNTTASRKVVALPSTGALEG